LIPQSPSVDLIIHTRSLRPEVVLPSRQNDIVLLAVLIQQQSPCIKGARNGVIARRLEDVHLRKLPMRQRLNERIRPVFISNLPLHASSQCINTVDFNSSTHASALTYQRSKPAGKNSSPTVGRRHHALYCFMLVAGWRNNSTSTEQTGLPRVPQAIAVNNMVYRADEMLHDVVDLVVFFQALQDLYPFDRTFAALDLRRTDIENPPDVLCLTKSENVEAGAALKRREKTGVYSSGCYVQEKTRFCVNVCHGYRKVVDEVPCGQREYFDKVNVIVKVDTLIDTGHTLRRKTIAVCRYAFVPPVLSVCSTKRRYSNWLSSQDVFGVVRYRPPPEKFSRILSISLRMVSATRPIGRRMSASNLQSPGIVLTLVPPLMVPMFTVGLRMLFAAPAPITSSIVSRTSCRSRYLLTSGSSLKSEKSSSLTNSAPCALFALTEKVIRKVPFSANRMLCKPVGSALRFTSPVQVSLRSSSFKRYLLPHFPPFSSSDTASSTAVPCKRCRCAKIVCCFQCLRTRDRFGVEIPLPSNDTAGNMLVIFGAWLFGAIIVEGTSRDARKVVTTQAAAIVSPGGFEESARVRFPTPAWTFRNVKARLTVIEKCTRGSSTGSSKICISFADSPVAPSSSLARIPVAVERGSADCCLWPRMFGRRSCCLRAACQERGDAHEGSTPEEQHHVAVRKHLTRINQHPAPTDCALLECKSLIPLRCSLFCCVSSIV
ncbi:acetylornithine deacetylase/succinyldiaminopimelate desuccinylase-like deacylase, partial [Aureobasidium melanogenum]